MSEPAPSFRPNGMDIQLEPAHDSKKRRLYRRALGLGLLAVVAGLLVFWLRPGLPRIPAARLWIDSAQTGPFERSVRGSGVLTPKIQRWMTAHSAALVERILIEPGTAVKAEDIVVETGNDELFEQLAHARNMLAAAQSDETSKRLALEGQIMDLESGHTTLRADHALAQLQTEREGLLAQKKLISELQYMQTQQRMRALEEQIRISERRLSGLRRSINELNQSGQARIEQLQQTVLHKQRQIDQLQIRAGIDGVVQSIKVDAGEHVATGAPVGLVVQTHPLLARLNIPEAQVSELALGMKARINLLGKPFDGHISRIAPSVQNNSVEVLIEPSDPLPAEARPELGVTGHVEIEKIEQALTIPRPADARPHTTGSLYRIDSDGIARKIQVGFGRASSDRIEITHGLSASERVVLSSLADWNHPPAFKIQ